MILRQVHKGEGREAKVCQSRWDVGDAVSASLGCSVGVLLGCSVVLLGHSVGIIKRCCWSHQDAVLASSRGGVAVVRTLPAIFEMSTRHDTIYRCYDPVSAPILFLLPYFFSSHVTLSVTLLSHVTYVTWSVTWPVTWPFITWPSYCSDQPIVLLSWLTIVHVLHCPPLIVLDPLFSKGHCSPP